MFGDIGHGFILLLLSVYLCVHSYQLQQAGNGAAASGIFKYRYLLLLMGVFAFYCGFIYNDFMSMPLNLFSSCYNEYLKQSPNCAYRFGLDPVWAGKSTNELQMVNSLKMKLSVIIGVTQMVLGIVLKGANAVKFKSGTDFIFEFIPQLIFMLSTFGYMVLLIIIKWLTDFSYNTAAAPSILATILTSFFNLGSTLGNTLYGREFLQDTIQYYLLIISVVCVPWMLIPKPIYLWCTQMKSNKNVMKNGHHLFIEDEDEEAHHPSAPQNDGINLFPEEKEFDIAEAFIDQLIETIEFVLGSISHTASYLRLWALSLAHSQLSEVFFEKTMKQGLESGNPAAIVIGFFIFALITFGILMCMDAMECFLHAIRLHWVEF